MNFIVYVRARKKLKVNAGKGEVMVWRKGSSGG